MADTVKFTDEELAKIKELQNLFNTVIYQAGQTYLEKVAFENKEKQIEANFKEVRRQEQELVSQLTETYGQGKINLETGEFMPVSTSEEEIEA